MQRNRKSLGRQWGLGPVCLAILFLVGGGSQAQNTSSDPPPDDLKSRVERLERQNQELRSLLNRQPADGQADTPPSDGRVGGRLPLRGRPAPVPLMAAKATQRP